MTIQFERAWLLLALVPCLALVYWLWHTSKGYLPPFRRAAALVLRSAIVTLLVLALAGPLALLRANNLAVAVLLDRSDSTTPAAQADQEHWLAQALASKGANDQVAVITFAGDARVERPLSDDATPPALAEPDGLHPERTNIAAAIRLGLGALPPNLARRLVLLSDGQQNQDQADEAAGLAAAAGVQLMAVPNEQSSGPEALVDGLEAPTQLRQGESFSATADIRATDPGGATLILLVDGTPQATQNVDLQPGENRFVLPLEPLGVGQHILRLQLEADADSLVENNSGGAFVTVSGPPSILIVEGSPGDGQYLADALQAQGQQVTVTDAHSAPLDADSLRSYAAVVLANVPASALAQEQMTALEAYVQSYGGGLVVSGGDQAFGPGGYARTPLEDMLPVQMGLRGKTVGASTALVLVIDTSGSMGDDVGGSNKLDLAKQAAMAAAQSLGEYDQIGVVSFSDQPQWVVQPTSASDLSPVEQAISAMQAGGGTDIYPALDTAYQGLAPLDAKVKHIVLLTDGQAPQGPYAQLTQQMNGSSISLSTIGIGADADTNLLQQLAQLGNGRYYDGNDPFDLPRLVLKDTQEVQRAAIVERDVQPRAGDSSPAVAGIDTSTLPALRGYVATTAKSQASVSVVSDQLDPLLSEWQFGLGHVVAWTSDATNRWSSRWVDWADFARFWSQVVQRAARPPDDPNRQVNVTIDGSLARITLDAQTGPDDPQPHYLNFQPAVATLVDPRGAQVQVALPQVAPGRYEATTPVQDDGVYQLEVQQTDPTSNAVATQSGGFVVPYSPEFKAAGTDRDSLAALASRTGGSIIADPAQAFAHDLPSVGAPQALWPYLLALAAALLVLDVGVRRVRFSARDAEWIYRAIRRRPAPAGNEVSDAWPVRRPVPQATVTTTVTRRPVGATHAAPRPRQAPADGRESRAARLVAARKRASRL